MSRPIVPLSEALLPARLRHRVVLEATRQWAAEQRCWLPLDLVALVIVAGSEGSRLRHDELPDDAEPGTYWTRTSVNELLMRDVPNWCSTRGSTWPFALPEAAWRFLDFLAATGRLHPDSDPVVELRRPLRCFGQLGPNGRWRPDAVADPGPCVCYQRYVGPSHGELAGRAADDR